MIFKIHCMIDLLREQNTRGLIIFLERVMKKSLFASVTLHKALCKIHQSVVPLIICLFKCQGSRREGCVRTKYERGEDEGGERGRYA